MYQLKLRNKRSLGWEGRLAEVEEDVLARVVAGMEGWVAGKVEEHPGCLERGVCEAAKALESSSGPLYILQRVVR